MARELYAEFPVFRKTFDRCNTVLEPLLGVPLRSIIDDPERLEQTGYAQPCLFAVEYAITELWRSWGIEPQALLGHSLGEYVAACVAGVFSLEDGLRLIAERARLMQALPAGGGMAAVFATPEAVTPYLRGAVEIAARNSPGNTVLSGDSDALDKVLKSLAAGGIDARPLAVSHAFHSRQLEPMLSGLSAALLRIELHPPSIPLVSNLTGEWCTSLDADYWRRHTRQPVRFQAGLELLAREGYSILVEVGPQAVLSTFARQLDVPWMCLPSLAKGRPEAATMLRSLGDLYEAGATVNWRAVTSGRSGRRVDLPRYPLQRKRFWIEKNMSSNAPSPLCVSTSTPSGSAAGARRQRIQSELTRLMANSFQLDASDIQADTSFLELGADSIVLIAAARAVESSYGVKIRMQQFFDEVSTLQKLAAYLDERITQEALPASTPPVVPVPAAAQLTATVLTTPMASVDLPASLQKLAQNGLGCGLGEGAGVSGGLGAATGLGASVERLMREQLAAMSQLISQQLQALMATGMASTPAVTPALPKVAPPATVVQPVEAAVKPAADVFAPWRKPQTQSAVLAPRQQEHLDALIRRYNARTPTSKELTQKYRPVLADNRASAGFRPSIKNMLYPLIGDHAEGAYFTDVDGNRFLDITMGFGVLLFGHSPAFVREAIAAQLQQGIDIGPQTRLAGEVAELVCELTGMERVTFCNSGTEAIMAALRIARTVTGRTKVVCFAGSYHGHSDQTLGAAEAGNAEPDAITFFPGVPQSAVSDAIVLEYAEQSSLDVIRRRAHEISAVLVEPVQSRRPDLQPKEFLQQLRALTRELGIALIFDETITGFRMHPGGAQAWFGVEADLATYGKVLGGGMPIGLVAGRNGVMDAIDGGVWQFGDSSVPKSETTFFAGTFMKHPLTMAAARATLRQLKSLGPEFQNGINRRTTRLADSLNDYFAAEDVPIQVAHFGSLFRFVFKTNMDLFFYHLLDRGIFIWEGRNCFLSAAHTDADVDFLIDSIRSTVDELRSGGFLPPRPDSPAPIGVPLTEAQQQLWVLAQLSDAGSIAYNDAVCLEIPGSIDARRLKRSLQQMLLRHEALRTTFDPSGEVQLVWPARLVELPVVELPRAGLMAWLQAQAAIPFRLAEGPVWSASLLLLDDGASVLVLRAHHLITDGWSWGVILNELSALYAGEKNLPAPMQFREYVALQQAQRDTPAMKNHEHYWLRKLDGATGTLDLPGDHPVPEARSYRGDRITVQLSKDWTANIRQMSRDHGSTLFMTLLAGFTTLMHRVAQSDDILIGTPVAARFPAGSDTLVGYCTHLLAIRSVLPSGASFRTHLRTVRDTLLTGFEHQEYPHAWLVHQTPSAAVNVTFNFDQPVVPPRFDGLQAQLIAAPVQSAFVDLTLNVMELGDGLALYCDYATARWEQPTVRGFLHQFEVLLAEAAAKPDTPVATLPLLNEAERNRLRTQVTATARPFPAQTVHELFEQQVRRTPGALAVCDDTSRFTYTELNGRANQVARHLLALGASPGMAVAVCLDRTGETVALLLGVLKAGCAYVPLDATHPPERLAFMVRDSGARFLITARPFLERVGCEGIVPIFVDEIPGGAAADLQLSVSPEQLMYLAYTSGSTGVPKCVEVPHRATVNRFQWMWEAFPFSAGEVCCQKTVLSFVDSVWELFGPLLQGVPSVVIPDAVVRDPARLIRTLASHRVSRFVLVPSLLRMLLESVPDLAKELPLLRIWVSSGEALAWELADRFHLALPDAILLNLYGSSEVAADVTWYQVDAPGQDGHRTLQGIPLGKPIANTEIYVLDRSGEPTGPGVAGEICVGGAGLAHGYRGRPELTAERFVPHPYHAGARLFRTGDLGRFLPDHHLEFLGRSDDQVKIRGMRVELGEIQSVLLAHPAIREALVSARPAPAGDHLLVAYYTVKEPVSAAELREYTFGKLPEYMTPAAWVQLPQFPLTPNGKINRQALPAPGGTATAGTVPYVAPNTNTEREIVRIWSELLAVEPRAVGIRHSFFALGGHSLLVVQAMNRLQDAFGISLTVAQLFDKKTVEELALLIEEEQILQASGDELSRILSEAEPERQSPQ